MFGLSSRISTAPPRPAARGTKRTALLLICAAALTLAPVLHAETPEETAVMAPVHRLFDGMAKADPALMRSSLTPGGSLTSFRHGALRQVPLRDMSDNAPAGWKPGVFEEKIRTPIIHIDDNIAVVWVPYGFYIDKKPHHCGTDIFNLVKVNGKWLIASAEDNSHATCSGW
jgi:Putative lumazine-binding